MEIWTTGKKHMINWSSGFIEDGGTVGTEKTGSVGPVLSRCEAKEEVKEEQENSLVLLKLLWR